MPLATIPVGTIIHNVEMKIGKRRSRWRGPRATYAQLVGKDAGYAQVKLHAPASCGSFVAECMATVGAVSNPDNQNQSARQGRAQRAGWAAARTTAAS